MYSAAQKQANDDMDRYRENKENVKIVYGATLRVLSLQDRQKRKKIKDKRYMYNNRHQSPLRSGLLDPTLLSATSLRGRGVGEQLLDHLRERRPGPLICP